MVAIEMLDSEFGDSNVASAKKLPRPVGVEYGYSSSPGMKK